MDHVASISGRKKIAEGRLVMDLPVWVGEVSVFKFGADEIQAWGVGRIATLLIGQAPRITLLPI